MFVSNTKEDQTPIQKHMLFTKVVFVNCGYVSVVILLLNVNLLRNFLLLSPKSSVSSEYPSLDSPS